MLSPAQALLYLRHLDDDSWLQVGQWFWKDGVLDSVWKIRQTQIESNQQTQPMSSNGRAWWCAKTDLRDHWRGNGRAQVDEISHRSHENWVVKYEELFKFNWSQALIDSVTNSGLHISNHPSMKDGCQSLDSGWDRFENRCWHHIDHIWTWRIRWMSHSGEKNSNVVRWIWRWRKRWRFQIDWAL